MKYIYIIILYFCGLHGNAQKLLLLKKLSEPLINYNIVWDGNSWIFGSGSTGGNNFVNQTAILLQNAGKIVNALNYGVAGQTIVQMRLDAATQIDSNVINYQILIALEVVNQSGLTTNFTADSIFNLYKQYFLDRKAAGFKYIFACTPHGQAYYTRTLGGDWATTRAYITNRILTEFPVLGIEVIDCGSDSRLQDPNNIEYFNADKIHLNNIGQGIQAQYAFDKLISLTK